MINKNNSSAGKSQKKANLHQYMSGTVFWHLIGNTYFPFSLHNKYRGKPGELFKNITKTMELGSSTPSVSDLISNFYTDYQMRDWKLILNDETYKFANKMLKQGTDEDKEYIDNHLPKMTLNGAQEVEFKTLTSKVSF
jgi:hypothetical protein